MFKYGRETKMNRCGTTKEDPRSMNRGLVGIFEIERIRRRKKYLQSTRCVT